MQKEELKSAILTDKHLFNDNLRSYLVRIIDLIEEQTPVPEPVVELPPVPEPVDQPVRSTRSQRVPLPSATEPEPFVRDA
jgi:hypothetical protein